VPGPSYDATAYKGLSALFNRLLISGNMACGESVNQNAN